MNNKVVFVIVFVVIVVLVVGFVLYKQAYKKQPETSTTTPSEQVQPNGEVKEFEITARQFSFEPSTITVNKGDTVKLTITSADVTHGFAIKEFNVNERLEPGKTVDVEFIADKTGTFSFYCSIVCGAGHSGMRGQLVVK